MVTLCCVIRRKHTMNKTARKQSNMTKQQQQQLLSKKGNNGPDESPPPPPPPAGKKNEKEKRRNNEKRKEKSRDAARTRRSRETEIFNELAAAVPMKTEDIEHLDKASVMRLAIGFLKSRAMTDYFPELKEKCSMDDDDEEMKMSTYGLNDDNATLKALDGFLLVLSSDGDISFVSENIAEHLGLTQIDLLGQPIWEYCHQCDHDELREALNGRKTSPSELLNGVHKGDCLPLVKRDFFLRLKCTLTSRGRSVNIKSASYKVIHITGHMVTNDGSKPLLLAVGQPLPHPSNIEVPLGSQTFLTKHALDMKFSYVDDKMSLLLGYTAEHLIGKSLYDFHHGADSDGLMATFKSLISKGQTETSRYRFLARCGGYAWVVTQATIVYDKQKPQSVVCVNYIISGVENKDEIYSCTQLAAQQETQQQTQPNVDDIVKKETKLDEQSAKVSTNNSHHNKSKQVLKSTSPPLISGVPIILNSGSFNTNIRRPRSVTAAIFASSTAQAVEKATTSTLSGQQPVPPIRGQSVTAKLFAASPTLSSLTASAAAAQQARLQNATSKTFVRRTEDMNKGYFMYCEEDTGLTMLKDEPDDLTHLAPTAGDSCISIDETTPFFSDMFDDFMIPEHYNTLLSDEINSLTTTSATAGNKSKTNITTNNNNNNISTSTNNNNNSTNNNNVTTTCNNNSNNSNTSNYRSSSVNSNTSTSSSSKSVSDNNNGSSDPFINYRDDSCDINNSPHLSSPGLAKSPEGSTSLPSLCSPNGSLPEDDFAFMTLNMDDDIDLTMRAPYIPMGEADDLPLLISDDLMWGAQPDEIKEAISQIKMNNNKNNNNNQAYNNNSDEKSVNFNTGKTLDTSSLAALLSNNNMFNQNKTHNQSSSTHHLLMQQQQESQLQDTTQHRLHEIQVHHVQITQQQQQQQPLQQQLNDLIEEIKPKLIDSRLQGDSNERNSGSNSSGGGGAINPMVIMGQAYKNNQLNPMEHTWTMNDLLQLNLNHNDAMNQQQQQHQQLLPQITPVLIKQERPTTNKRSSHIFSIDPNSSAAKRLKSTLSVSVAQPAAVVPSMVGGDTKTSPHLLEQLMAPLTQTQRAKLKNRSINDGHWNLNGTNDRGNQQQKQSTQSSGGHQPSNSVLMNLLDSPKIVIHEENSQDSVCDHCLPMESTDSNNVLLHHDNSNQFLANPMIGGVNINGAVSPSLLSPNDIEIWRAIQQKRTNTVTLNNNGNLVDNLLMELDEQDYSMGLSNDLLAALDEVVAAPSPTSMLT